MANAVSGRFPPVKLQWAPCLFCGRYAVALRGKIPSVLDHEPRRSSVNLRGLIFQGIHCGADAG